MASNESQVVAALHGIASTNPLAEIARQIRVAGFPVTAAFLTDSAGAAFTLGRSAKTLRNWRSLHDGPGFVLIHGRAWYALADLVAWR